MWSHRDIVDNVFTIDDLLDAHEILTVRAKNEELARLAAEVRAKGGV